MMVISWGFFKTVFSNITWSPSIFSKKTSMYPDGLKCVSSSLRTFFGQTTFKFFQRPKIIAQKTFHPPGILQNQNNQETLWHTFDCKKIFLSCKAIWIKLLLKISTFLEQVCRYVSRRLSFFQRELLDSLYSTIWIFFTPNHIVVKNDHLTNTICDILK